MPPESHTPRRRRGWREKPLLNLINPRAAKGFPPPPPGARNGPMAGWSACRATGRSRVDRPTTTTAETADPGVSLRCAPGRAARCVGHDTAVPNAAGPTSARRAIGSTEMAARAGRRVPGPPGAHPSRVRAIRQVRRNAHISPRLVRGTRRGHAGLAPQPGSHCHQRQIPPPGHRRTRGSPPRLTSALSYFRAPCCRYRPSTCSENDSRQYGSSIPAALPPRQPRSAAASSIAARPPKLHPRPALMARSVG